MRTLEKPSASEVTADHHSSEVGELYFAWKAVDFGISVRCLRSISVTGRSSIVLRP
jgi:hypothetical protein